MLQVAKGCLQHGALLRSQLFTTDQIEALTRDVRAAGLDATDEAIGYEPSAALLERASHSSASAFRALMVGADSIENDPAVHVE